MSANDVSTIMLSDPSFFGEREVQVGNLSLGWKANGAARASCHLPARDAHLLGFRNLLNRWMWTNDRVGPWAGYLQDLSSESSDGTIELSFVDMADQLAQMTTPRTYQMLSSSAGGVISRAIRDGGLETGAWLSNFVIDEAGPAIKVEWRGDSVLSVLSSTANRASGMWGVSVDPGRNFTFTYLSQPIDRRDKILLIEGREVVSGSIRPSISQLVNDIVGIANDRNWQAAASARAWDEDSKVKYGARRQTRRYEGLTKRSSLDTAVRADLEISAVPSGPVSLQIVSSHPIVRELRHSQLVRLWSWTQNRRYDLTITGLAHETGRGVVTVVGRVVEAV